jgi:hypothetical protein
VAAHAVAIAVAPDGRALALGDRDATHVDAIRIAADGTPSPPSSVELAGAGTLFALEATPTRFVVVSLTQCTTDDHASPCLHVRPIAPDDAHAGEARTLPLPAPLRSSRVFAAGETIYLARTHQGALPALDRFTVNGDTIAQSTVLLGAGDPALAEEPTEILGLTGGGGSYAVLWRRGATEDAESAVLLSTQLDEHEIASLHDALIVESMAWLAGSISMIVSLEFARPSYVRIGADGEVRAPPETLRVHEEPPAPFGGRRVAMVRGEARALGVQIRDAAGDDVGERLSLGEHAVLADVARSDTGFVVLTAEDAETGRTLALRRITCP